MSYRTLKEDGVVGEKMGGSTGQCQCTVLVLVLYALGSTKTPAMLPLLYFPSKCNLHFQKHHVHYLEISA